MRRVSYRRGAGCAALVALTATWLTSLPATAQTAPEVQAALDVAATNFVSASFGTSDDAGSIVTSTPAAGFPTAGSDYLVLSSGRASDAFTPNNSGSLSTTLGGRNNSQGQDLVQLDLGLEPPAGATCLTFDFRFFSDEFPEFVGSSFNDAFTAETVQTGLQIMNNQVVTPYNFAFDDDANAISVNTTFGLTTGGTGTTYDGATPLLRAVTPVERSSDGRVHVWLTVQDLGDSSYDSAVFVDNLRWQTGGDCDRGASAFSDRDGDALLDSWETDGLDVDSDGDIDLDLPAMGADPDHKDIFIELDYMVDEPWCFLFCFGGHSHKPKKSAVDRVVAAFRNAPVGNPDGDDGINLHVDAGSDTVMNPVTGATWGSRTRASEIGHIEDLGVNGAGGYDWAAFDTIKTANFPVARRDVFHYGVYAHNYGGGTSSGISRGILASDFIVSLGSFTDGVGTTTEQAGTLMHEFGHNLNLMHGGDDNDNYKPNYLSIMNYAFQLGGLIDDGSTGHADYSRADLNTLDESDLDERIGLRPAGSVDDLGTYYYCAGARRRVDDATAPINWDCGDAGEESVSEDINNEDGHSELSGFDDWANIRYDGGAVGKLGQSIELPQVTPLIEASKEELAEAGALDADHKVVVDGPGDVRVLPGSGAHSLRYVVSNEGRTSDTYTVAATAGPHADLGGVPATVTLAPGQQATVDVPVSLPDAAASESVRLVVTSIAEPMVMDEAETAVTAGVLDAASAGDVVRAAIDGLTALKATKSVYAADADAAIGQLRSVLAALPTDSAEAILRLRKAITSLEQLGRKAAPADPATAAQAAGLVDALGSLARTLANAEIDAAVAAGGDPAGIALARRRVDDGDGHRAAGRMEAALNAYREAVVAALGAMS